MRVLVEEVPREAHRVAQKRDLRDGPRPPVGAHEARVEPRDAVGLEVRAGARVEQWLVLERAHRGLDRVERRAPAVQDAPARVGRPLAGLVARAFLSGRRRAAAPVHDQRCPHGRQLAITSGRVQPGAVR